MKDVSGHTSSLCLVNLSLEKFVTCAHHTLTTECLIHDELDRLTFIENVFILIHNLGFVHSTCFESTVHCLCSLPLIDIRCELVILWLGLFIPLIEHILLFLPVDFTLFRDVVLWELVPIDFIINFETFLDESQELLFAVQIGSLSFRDLHTREESLVIRDFLPE